MHGDAPQLPTRKDQLAWRVCVSDQCPVESETINIDLDKNNSEFVFLFER